MQTKNRPRENVEKSSFDVSDGIQQIIYQENLNAPFRPNVG